MEICTKKRLALLVSVFALVYLISNTRGSRDVKTDPQVELGRIEAKEHTVRVQDSLAKSTVSVSEKIKKERRHIARSSVAAVEKLQNEVLEDGYLEDIQLTEKNEVAYIFSKFPTLKKYYSLDNTYLRSSVEKSDFEKLLVDRSRLKGEFDAYKDSHKRFLKEGMNPENYFRTQFLRKAMRLQDNPERQYIVEGIKEMIQFVPSEFSKWPSKKRQWLIADKIQLIYILKLYAPDDLTLLKSEGNRKIKWLIDYALRNEKTMLREFT